MSSKHQVRPGGGLPPWRHTLSLPFFFLSGFAPRRTNRVLFGAWQGKRYGDNPRFLAEYLVEAAPDLELVWCGREQIRGAVSPRLRFVRYGSLRSLWMALTAGTCFISHAYTDIAKLNLLRSSRLVDLGHGFAIKNMGAPAPEAGDTIGLRVKSLLRRIYSCDYYAASSEAHANKLIHEYRRWLIHEGKILRTGQPRLDPLFRSARDPSKREAIRRQFCERYGVPLSGPLVAYLPTFRDETQRLFSFSGLTLEQCQDWDTLMADTGATVVEKGHPVEASSSSDAVAASPHPWLVNLSSTPDVDTQALLTITDVLITDYSGVYLDFLTLDRPIIHFAYDLEEYVQHDRGMHYELHEVAGGSIVRTIDELSGVVRKQLAEPAVESSKRAALRERMLTWEQGLSSRHTAEALGLVPRQGR